MGEEKKEEPMWAFKQQVMRVANRQATIYGLGTLAAVAGATVFASRRWHAFNIYTSVSTKTSIAPMAGLAVYFFKYEYVAFDSQKYPEKYKITPPESQQSTSDILSLKDDGNLPLPNRIVNACYDNPHYIVAGLGIPLASAILYQQLQNRHLKVSQRILHSRVFAQAGVLAIFVTAMMFGEYLKRQTRQSGAMLTEQGHEPLPDEAFDMKAKNEL